MEIKSSKEIQGMDRIKRLNLINSISGISPANLVGTISNDLTENLAIISSVVNIGSNPPLIGFILRPTKKTRRDTYENIFETNQFTINHIHSDMIKKSHYTSAKFKKNESEFKKCQLTPEYLNSFQAPYVKESYVKIGLNLEDIHLIKSNGCRLIVGCIEHIYVPENAIHKNGNIQLELLNSIGVGGLNTYYSLNKITQYSYARVEDPFFKKA
jgi:flavin reductase (DIM6/NTAB) family NADH-FMN oxidoreductase RutF